jgi:hypothetical protein
MLYDSKDTGTHQEIATTEDDDSSTFPTSSADEDGGEGIIRVTKNLLDSRAIIIGFESCVDPSIFSNEKASHSQLFFVEYQNA